MELRLSRYNELEKRKHQKAVFQSSQNRFYRELETETAKFQPELNILDATTFGNYCKSIWARDDCFNRLA